MTSEPATSERPSTDRAAPRTLRGQLFPEAYRSTIAGGRRELLPGVRRWLVAVAAVLLLLLVLSIPVWRAATAELRSAVEGALAPQPAAATTDSLSEPPSEPAAEP